MNKKNNVMAKTKVTKTRWQSPRGTTDLYDFNESLKQIIEKTCQEVVDLFNYQKIETPIFEYAQVFKSGVGNTTDIITKELYEFADKKNRQMALRPEGTAGIVRAVIEHDLLKNAQFHKLYYNGPMFRYERPQKGRQRQFHQFGIENFSAKNPYIDFEIILIGHLILKKLDIRAKLIINSLGNFATRHQFSLQLKKYLTKFATKLSEDSQKRLETNPLRILDDKNDRQKDFMKNAPKINQFYSEQENNYFQSLVALVEKNQIDYQIDHSLVRGLDYYTETIFEFVPLDKAINNQSTLLAGGRYDMLMENLGGPEKSGVGLAIGIERIIEQMKAKDVVMKNNVKPLIFVANLSSNATEKIHEFVISLRNEGLKVEWNVQSQKLAKVFTKSDIFKPDAMIIIGEKEINENHVQLKIGKTKKTIAFNEVVAYLKEYFKKIE